MASRATWATPSAPRLISQYGTGSLPNTRVRQSEILRDSAHTVLTATQRRLVAQLDEFYAEAATSRDQLQSLDQSVQTASESLRLTRLRYTAGRPRYSRWLMHKIR